MYNERDLTGRARSLRRNQTDAERKLWAEIRNRGLDGIKFRRQVPIGPYVVDFVCWEQRRVVVLDGSQHAENPHDEARTAFLNERGFRVIRFWNHEVFENIEGVLETIRREILA